MSSLNPKSVPYGECHCGCGGLTPLMTRTDRMRGYVKGQPIRFIPGHQVGTRPVYDPSPAFFIDGEPCKRIPLTLGFFAIVDADVYEEQWNYKWFATIKETGVYAARNAPMVRGMRGAAIYLHRAIMQTPLDQQCDHERHGTLDNRRSQLRNCAKRDNTKNVKMHRDNSTGFKGVALHKKSGLYFSRIMNDGQITYLGSYREPAAAAKAYDAKAIELHGEFACLNFPLSQQEKDIHVFA